MQLSIDLNTLREIVLRHAPAVAERILRDVLRSSAILFSADPPPRELTLDEEIGRMWDEGNPNCDD